MKKMLAASTGLVALVAGPAIAADLRVKAPIPKAPPAVVAPLWTGFYIGGHVGGIASSADTSVFNFAPFSAAAGGSYLFVANYPIVGSTGANNLSRIGFLGGLQAGYNRQISNLVLGVEADISGASVSAAANASAPYVVSAPPATFNWATSVRQDLFATIRGRAGYAAGQVLFYATGGLAISEVRFNKTFTDNFPPPPGGFGQVTVQDVMTGWTLGAGIEVAVAPNWTVKGEYLYADLGSLTGSSSIAHPAYTGGDTFSASAHVRDSIARLGFNYKIGSPITQY
jgi:outer membrane immunogenic protein